VQYSSYIVRIVYIIVLFIFTFRVFNSILFFQLFSAKGPTEVTIVVLIWLGIHGEGRRNLVITVGPEIVGGLSIGVLIAAVWLAFHGVDRVIVPVLIEVGTNRTEPLEVPDFPYPSVWVSNKVKPYLPQHQKLLASLAIIPAGMVSKPALIQVAFAVLQSPAT
jgi:hypothetical protein